MLTAAALSACLAIGCGVYLLSGGPDQRVVLTVLSLTMGLALLALIIHAYIQNSRANGHLRQVRNEMRTVERGFRESQGRTDYLATQMLELRQRSEQVSGAIMNGLDDLKASHASLSDQMRNTNTSHVHSAPFTGFAAKNERQWAFGTAAMGETEPVRDMPHSSFTPPPFRQASGIGLGTPSNDQLEFVAPKAEQPAQAHSAPMLDKLSTSLEPIVDLFTGKTTHYRLHLGMTKQDGEDVGSDIVLHHADRTGLRAGFDIHAARESFGLLRRLRQRDPSLHIFLPIGAATLQSDHAIHQLIDLRDEFPDIGDGLVLEVPHAMLAGLPESGLEGLAQLARHGHVFSLANVSVSGIDLPSLAKLHVRYVSMNSSVVSGVDGPMPAITQFAQAARAMRIHLVITNVTDMRVVPFLSKVSRFASGLAFAEPRRVKADAAAANTAAYGAVA